MTRLRIILLPLAALLELVLLAGTVVLAVVAPARAERLARWATDRLPSLRWYSGTP